MKYMRERERGGKNVFYLRLMKPIFDEWAWILPLHKKIQFISSSRRVIFFLLYCLNAKSGKWRHRYLHQWEYGKYVTVYFRIKHSHLYNKLFSLIISWLVRFLLFYSGIYISYWLTSRFIDCQRSVLHLTATRINKQYIREPHQSWYKLVIHLNLGIYVV